jgi:large subunit ribosomal protein L19
MHVKHRRKGTIKMDKLKKVEEKHMKKEIPKFQVGDTVKVFIKITEEGKQRLQAFEGIAIAKKGAGIRETFTVRRVSYGEGVERIFSLHSPSVDRIQVIRRGKVRRAKLYYLRKKVGKKTVVEEKVATTSKK